MDIQAEWLGRMQNEIGVLTSNVMLKDVQLAVNAKEISDLQALVDALRARNKDLELGIQQLRANPPRTRRTKRVTDGSNAT